MKAYLINLGRSPERLAAADAALRTAGVAYTRVEGVDGRALDAKALRTAANRVRFRLIYGAWPSAGTIGCALSHQAVYRRMIAEDDSLALVFEDDIAIPAPEAFRRTVAAIAQDNDPAVPTAWRLEQRPTDPPVAGAGFWPAKPGVCGACAYAVNLAGARLLARLNRAPIVALADDWPRFGRLGLRALRFHHRQSGAPASAVAGGPLAPHPRPGSRHRCLPHPPDRPLKAVTLEGPKRPLLPHQDGGAKGALLRPYSGPRSTTIVVGVETL